MCLLSLSYRSLSHNRLSVASTASASTSISSTPSTESTAPQMLSTTTSLTSRAGSLFSPRTPAAVCRVSSSYFFVILYLFITAAILAAFGDRILWPRTPRPSGSTGSSSDESIKANEARKDRTLWTTQSMACEKGLREPRDNDFLVRNESLMEVSTFFLKILKDHYV